MSNDKNPQVSQQVGEAKRGIQARNREGLGHSRGGLTTKIHLAADHRCRPLVVITSEGQRHDSIAFETVMGAIKVPRVGPGRPPNTA